MTERSFDALTKSLGRRSAVQALAAAAGATLSGVTLVGAKSNNGNKNKRKNKKQNKQIQKKALALCVGQVAQCQTLVGAGNAQAICCDKLADCDFDGLLACLNAP